MFVNFFDASQNRAYEELSIEPKLTLTYVVSCIGKQQEPQLLRGHFFSLDSLVNGFL